MLYVGNAYAERDEVCALSSKAAKAGPRSAVHHDLLASPATTKGLPNPLLRRSSVSREGHFTKPT